MVARILGRFVSDGGQYGTGTIHDCELLPDAPGGDILVTSGWLAWEPFRKAMNLLGHMGADLNHQDDAGSAISLPARGKVIANRWSKSSGNVVEIDIGVAGGVREVLGFHHLESRSPFGEGVVVSEGQTIGRIGTTGTASTGPHLHFTRRSGPPDRFGNLADPIELFGSDPVDGVLDDVLPTLNEMYLWITDAYYGGYNPDFKSHIEVIEHPDEWDRQIVLSQRQQ